MFLQGTLCSYSCLDCINKGHSMPHVRLPKALVPASLQSFCLAQVAAGLTDAALPKGNCAVRIMLFVGGPTTEGGGQVVDKELSEPIRSHKVRICGSLANPCASSSSQLQHSSLPQRNWHCVRRRPQLCP